MKVKKHHISVLAATCLMIATKLLEDHVCRDLGKFLIRQANLTFGKVRLQHDQIDSNTNRLFSVTLFVWKCLFSKNLTGKLTMQLLLISCLLFLSCHRVQVKLVPDTNRRTWLRIFSPLKWSSKCAWKLFKKSLFAVFDYFLSIELADKPCLELALAALMTFNYKDSFNLLTQLKMNKIPFRLEFEITVYSETVRGFSICKDRAGAVPSFIEYWYRFELVV